MSWREKVAFLLELSCFVGIVVSSEWDEYFMVAAGLGALLLLWQYRRNWK